MADRQGATGRAPETPDHVTSASSPATTATVLVRSAPDEHIARLNFRERVSTSLWFTPAVFVIGAFVLSKLTVALDREIGADRLPRWLIGAQAEGAEALASTVATAMLTFLAVVFSTTLVAVQLASGQYSPRIVRVFVRSPLTHVTLGVFLATFLFALNALVETRGGTDPFVPVVTVSMVYVLVLATLGMFITFLHGMVKMLRVQYLLQRVTADGRRTLSSCMPDVTAYRDAPRPVPSVGTTVRNRERTGILQSVDKAALVRLAAERGVVIELLLEVGEYLAVGTPLAVVHGSPPAEVSSDEIVDHFLLGGERTLVQDPGFAFRQLVDVAIRALSPAVNDPTTAVQAIDRIVDLLATVATRPDPSGWYVDDSGIVRLRCREPGLARLTKLGFTEIVRYGADSPQVGRRLRAAFDVLRELVRPDVRSVIDELRRILDTTEASLLPAGFAALASEPDRHGLG